MEIALLSGLLGILGGIVSGIIVSILSQRKTNAEIKRLEAETRKIDTDHMKKRLMTTSNRNYPQKEAGPKLYIFS